MLKGVVERENYLGFFSSNAILNQNFGIEALLGFSLQSRTLENQIFSLTREPDDPPETLHTPWGVWIHWRDPLHNINQRYDTEHVVRTANAALDILHYAHYVPVIGGHEYKHESYEMNFDYDYSREELPYDSNIEIEKDTVSDTKTIFTIRFEDDTAKSDDNEEHEERLRDEKSMLVDKEPQNNVDPELEKELTKIFEKILTFKLTNINKHN